jgi:alcohol dehydrogenase class IV
MINALKSMNLTVPEILFGLGVIGDLGNRARSIGATKVMIVTDEGVAGVGILDRVLGILEKSKIACGVFGKVEKEPSLENVESAFKEASGSSCQAVVGLGGGSSIDVAKMVAVLLKYGGNLRDYLARQGPRQDFPPSLSDHGRNRLRSKQIRDFR